MKPANIRDRRSRRRLLVAAGSMLLASLGFAQPQMLEPGYTIDTYGAGLGGLTQICVAPDGTVFAANLGGTIFAFTYDLNGTVSAPATVATGVGQLLLGVAADADGSLYVSSNDGADNTGFIARLRDLDDDGVFENEQRFITNLPNQLHHNDQLILDGRTLYFAMGSRTDDGEADSVAPVPAATILSIDLDTVNFASPANVPSVYAYGLRNAFGITLDDRTGHLWTADNGRDSPFLPDPLHRVRPGRHHGFPAELAPPDAVAPVADLGLGASANGCDFQPAGGRWGPDNADLFVCRFEADERTGVGMDVLRVVIDESDPNAPAATYTRFAEGFSTPLDVEVDPCGDLLVAEFFSNIYRIRIDAAPLPGDVDRDCDVDVTDLAILLAAFGERSAATSAADFNGNCRVDVSDLAALLANFGAVCP